MKVVVGSGPFNHHVLVCGEVLRPDGRRTTPTHDARWCQVEEWM